MVLCAQTHCVVSNLRGFRKTLRLDSEVDQAALFAYVLQEGGGLDISGAGNGDQRGALQDFSQQGRIELSCAPLANDVAVVGDHCGCAPSQQQLGKFGGRVGRVEVNKVDGGHLAAQLRKEGQTDWRGQEMGLPSRFGYRNAVDGLARGGLSGIGDEYAGVNALFPQAASQQADADFDSAEDRVIVLVEQQYFHAAAVPSCGIRPGSLKCRSGRSYPAFRSPW